MSVYTDDPQTRVEAILQNILGKNNLLQPPQTRVEELLLLILNQGLGGVTYKGVTTTELTDGSTTNPIIIDGNEVEAQTGDFVAYDGKEFVWNGESWQELGDLELVVAVMSSIAPQYISTETYNTGRRVYNDNVLYECTEDNVTGDFDQAKWNQVTITQILSEIENDVDSLFDIISDTYDPSETYNEGRLVIHNKKLYKCKVNGTTGAWNSAKWDETSIAYELENATPVEANPAEDATAELNKLKIFDDVYSVGNAHFMPISQEDYDALTDEEIHNGTIYFIYDTPALEVTANPEDDPEQPLVKLSIDGVIYYVPAELPEVNSEDNGKVLKVVNGDWGAAAEVDPTSVIDDTTTGATSTWSSNKIEEEIDGIPDPTVTKTASGNPIELTDAASAPMVKCVSAITGSQDLHGYDKPWVGGARKNKLIDSGYVQGVLGWNETTADSIVANTHFISSPYMPINNNTAYTLSAIHGNIVRIYVTDENHNTLYFRGNNPLEGNNELIPATSGAVYCRVSIGIDDEAVIPSDYGTKVYGQLELGSTATAYEPYSNICPITAYTEGEIVERGKNIIEVDTDYQKQNVSYVTTEGGIDLTATGTYSRAMFVYSVKAGTRYTISLKAKADGNYNYIYIGYNKDDWNATYNRFLINSTNAYIYKKYTFTATTDELCIGFYLTSNETSGSMSCMEIMLEEGSTATTYEPYTSTTHTTTYPNAIYRGSEDCVKGSVSYDMKTVDLGSLAWSYNSTYTYFEARLTDLKIYNNGDTPNMACEAYQVINARYGSAMSGAPAGTICPRAEQNFIQIKDTNYTDATLFKTSVTGYKLAYELATPTTSSVTPTNLPIKSLSGYNHIESSTGEMEIEYITEEEQPIIDLIENSVVKVVPNPSGTATEILNKLGIDNAIYEIPKELPSVTSTDDDKVLTVVNGSWEKANPQTGVSESVIADEYDSTKTYNIADYCMHNGKLYKCKTANTTGAWDSAKWDETCIGDELTLKTAVIVAPRVDQTATYTYNGTEQTLAFEYINSNNTIVTGNKHTDAGTYTCTVSLKNPNDLWSDTMDNVDKTFTWTINKVTSSIALSPTSFYFTDDTPQTMTATVTGQPFVLSGYDTSLIAITQVSHVSDVYTYSIVASGTAGTTTITASIAESTNYTAASATAAVETEEFTPGTVTIVPWSTGTDTEIQAMLDAYYADKLTWAEMGWAIGDTRVIHLSAMQAPNPNSSSTWSAQDITVVIVAHDHSDLATPINGHTKACITVQTREVMNSNTSAYNQAGHIYVNGDSSYDMTFTKWSDLYMRTYMNSVVFNAFDSSFKSMIKPSNHYRHTTYNGTESEQVTDNLFLPSYPEIFGTASYSYYVATNPVEGTQFSYYATSSNRIKYGNNNGSSNGTSQYWWEGSASSYFNSTIGYCWCLVNTSGGAYYNRGDNARGLAPAFVM